ncbi:MAG TPA: hypothetical protein VJ352_08375 [Geodermatophilus sp.]|nr:hypothetical protein [Geodermatophilus sp.]
MLAVRGGCVLVLPRTAADRHRRPVSSGGDGGVGQDPHHPQPSSPVDAGGRVPPPAVVADDDRHPRVADLGQDVEERLGRILGVLDRVAGGLAGGQEEIVALVVGQGGRTEEDIEPSAEQGDRELGGVQSPFSAATIETHAV